MKLSQRSLTEHYVFLFGSLAVAPLAPVGFGLFLLFQKGIDGRAVLEVGTGGVILLLMAFAVLEYETDGLVSWLLGGGVQTPRLGLSYFVGMIMKGLAILHGVVAVSIGNLLIMEPETMLHLVRPLALMDLSLRVALVVWLWMMTAVSFMAGDGWIRRSRRADNPDGMGLE